MYIHDSFFFSFLACQSGILQNNLKVAMNGDFNQKIVS